MQENREHPSRPTYSGMASASIDQEGVATNMSVGIHSSPFTHHSTSGGKPLLWESSMHVSYVVL